MIIKEKGDIMKECYKTYYLKNGRLDLSLLEAGGKLEVVNKIEKENNIEQVSKVYMDDKICSILEEMSSYFLEDEKNEKNT